MMPSKLIRTGLMLACLSLPFTAKAQPQFFSDPQSKAPFSPAVRVGDIIFLSGQTGHDAQGHLPEGMAAQAQNAMDNVAATARRAGVTNDNIVKCTVMLADMSQFATFNAIYVRSFKPGRLPARSAFGANGLANGALVEVECIAAAPTSHR